MRRVVVTRPAPEAQLWVDAMLAQGIAATALPLIDIRPIYQLETVGAIEKAHQQLGKTPGAYQAVMFVSAAAVNHFFIAKNDSPQCRIGLNAFQPGHCRAWATGQGTVRALVAAGVPVSQIDSPAADSGQWDSEALWARIASQVDSISRVLIVRGANAKGQLQGRDWLATKLNGRSIEVQQIAVYERHLPNWTPAQIETAKVCAQSGLWVFSASEALGNLATLLPDSSWQAAQALATHPRIAKAAQDAGFGVVCESLPGLTQVIASIKSPQ